MFEDYEITNPVLAKAARLRHVREIVKKNFLGRRLGRLSTMSSGFIVELEKNMTDIQYEFILGHEIGHTFHFSIFNSPPESYVKLTKEIEYECDMYACELLMTPKFVEEHGRGLNGVYLTGYLEELTTLHFDAIWNHLDLALEDARDFL